MWIWESGTLGGSDSRAAALVTRGWRWLMAACLVHCLLMSSACVLSRQATPWSIRAIAPRSFCGSPPGLRTTCWALRRMCGSSRGSLSQRPKHFIESFLSPPVSQGTALLPCFIPLRQAPRAPQDLRSRAWIHSLDQGRKIALI